MDDALLPLFSNAACQAADLYAARSGTPTLRLMEKAGRAVAEAAQSLSGQFALAEVEGEQRIYHVTTEVDEQGEEQEYVEHIMNEGDNVVKFVAWFFDGFFDIKQKDVYQAAGKTYKQPKRH